MGRRFRRIGQDGADLARLRLGVLQRAFHQGGERAGDRFEVFGARADAAQKIVERLLAVRQGGAHAAFGLFERGGGFRQRLQLRADAAVSERPRSSSVRASSVACWMAPLETERKRLDLVGDLLGCTAGLCCDLGQQALDLLDAARKPVLDGAEIAAGAGRDLLQQAMLASCRRPSTSDNSPRRRSLVPTRVSTARAEPSSTATRIASVDCM